MQTIPADLINNFNSLIDNAERIALVSHTNPDGDALGSSLGMKHYLQDIRGKKVELFLDSRFSGTLEFVFTPAERTALHIFRDDPQATTSAFKGFDLIICLDFNTFDRIGSLAETVSRFPAPKVLIDHHLNPQREAFVICFSDTRVSSASELTYHILKLMPDIAGKPEKIPSESLKALMTGITTDTNNFANSVFPTTLACVSELLAAGVDRDGIIDHIYRENSESRLRLQGYLLAEGMKITEDGGAYMVLSKALLDRFGVKNEETEGFVNMPLEIKNVKLSILVREDIDYLKVSLRSKRGVSANIMAKEFFHGGGHEQASGGKILPSDGVCSVTELPEYLEKCIKEYLNR